MHVSLRSLINTIMSKREYIKALNHEIQKLNGVIDLKIIADRDYSREARRHKKLLSEIRKQEVSSSVAQLFSFLRPSWF